jgi:hypothetical protein
MIDEKKLRLKKLIEHWAEHNDEHISRFIESAQEALELELSRAAYELKAAAKMGEKVSNHLRSALESI